MFTKITSAGGTVYQILETDNTMITLSGSLVTTTWRVLSCGWRTRPPDMEGSCKYTESVTDSRQRVDLERGVRAGEWHHLTVRNYYITKCYTERWSGSIKLGKFLHHMSNYQLLNKVSAPWSELLSACAHSRRRNNFLSCMYFTNVFSEYDVQLL
jgi:hypothetical protein